jgi:hypothetical protein
MKPLFHGLLFCLAAAYVLAQAPAADRSEPIHGQVVSAADGVPLRRARVELIAGRRLDPVVTDDEGRFQVFTPAAAPLTVRVNKAGYVPGFITVPAGKRDPDLRIALVKGGAVMGRVLDRYGAPVRAVTGGARLILPAADTRPAAARQFSTRTDGLGEYRLGGLPPGRFEIVAARLLPGAQLKTSIQDLPFGAPEPFGSPESFEFATGGSTMALATGEEVQGVDFTIAGSSETCPIGSSRKPPEGVIMASIAGRVTGVSGEPLACARLGLAGSDVSVPDVYTDAQGRYVIEGLPAGSFILLAGELDYLSLYYDQRHPSDAATPIVLRDKEQRTRVDFALPRGSFVSGTVVDEHGEPVEGITVSALRLRRIEGRTATFSSALPVQTDDRGQYRLIGLEPGSYIVAAMARGAVSATSLEQARAYVSYYYPSTPDLSYAQRVVLDAGRNADGIDIAFAPTRTFTVSGSVSGPVFETIGRPFDGNLTLSVSAKSGAVSVESRPGQVDASGRFVVRNVPPGDYVVKASALPRGVWLFGMQFVTVTDADPPPVTLTVVEGATVEGSWSIEGVPDPNGISVEVSAYSADPDYSRGPPGVLVRSDPSSAIPGGRFLVDGVTGPSRFQVTTPECEGCYLRSVYVNGADVTTTPFDFGIRGGVYRDVEIVLSDAGAALEGRATDERKAAVAASHVLVFSTDRRLWYPASPYLKGARPSGGSFRVTGLPPGEYFVAAVNRVDTTWLGSELADPEVLEQLAKRAERVTLSERDRRRLDLRLVRR